MYGPLLILFDPLFDKFYDPFFDPYMDRFLNSCMYGKLAHRDKFVKVALSFIRIVREGRSPEARWRSQPSSPTGTDL